MRNARFDMANQKIGSTGMACALDSTIQIDDSDDEEAAARAVEIEPNDKTIVGNVALPHEIGSVTQNTTDVHHSNDR